MTHADRIRRLASEYGIASEFIDARGEAVQIDVAVQAELLESMGVLGSAAAPQSGDSTTPHATMVVRADRGRVTIELGSDFTRSSVGWEITFENGTVRKDASKVISGGPHKAAIHLRDIPCGYHQLIVEGSDPINMIVTPGRCWLPDQFSGGGRVWGIALQLYLLRSARNWGIGDFTDLARFAAVAAGQGCDVLGLNPLHQMFVDAPEHASPYSPATRYSLNMLYIDVEAIPEFRDSRAAKELLRSAEFKRRLVDCRSARLVDYTNVTRLKLQALRLAHAEFRSNASNERRDRFLKFVGQAGKDLETASLFQVLRNHFAHRDGAGSHWHHWPEEFHSPATPEARQFARDHSGEIEFFNWLQWIADQQLADAKEAAAKAGMRIGFYRDLAVGCDRTGSETWAKSDFLDDVEVGAPPDILNPSGQNWGLPPFNPIALPRHGYRPFIELVRANMRHAGGLRIDHVMGLQRLYCIPEGAPASGGAYVSYPVDDLVGIIALESHRHRCFVVGEDLGTVPPGFRERMAEANVLSYRVLFFEQAEDGKFRPPEQYPRLAVAVAGSHDMPPLRGWLGEADIKLKERLGLYGSAEESAAQHAMREKEKRGVLEALRLPGDATPESAEFAEAVHDFLARTNCMLALAQLDDLLDEADPVNVPATSTEHPNWRRKYSAAIEDLADNHPAWRLIKSFQLHRPWVG
jgi:4-alpha-glucanotransferase